MNAQCWGYDMTFGEVLALIGVVCALGPAIYYFGAVSANVKNIKEDVEQIAECRKADHEKLWAAQHQADKKLDNHENRLVRLETK